MSKMLPAPVREIAVKVAVPAALRARVPELIVVVPE